MFAETLSQSQKSSSARSSTGPPVMPPQRNELYVYLAECIFEHSCHFAAVQRSVNIGGRVSQPIASTGTPGRQSERNSGASVYRSVGVCVTERGVCVGVHQQTNHPLLFTFNVEKMDPRF